MIFASVCQASSAASPDSQKHNI